MSADSILRPPLKICCIGTGVMGFGVALFFALHGYGVSLAGRSRASLAAALVNIKQALSFFVERGLATDQDIARALGNITPCLALPEAAAGAGFVLESVVEDLAVKREVLARVEGLVDDDAILASNTSGLPPSAIAENLKRPERFTVAHFWNPPHLVPLVEVAPGAKTSRRTLDETAKLLANLGKHPVVLRRESIGFIGNRLQFAMLREALHLVEAGIATAEEVDACVKYGFARRLCVCGPLESAAIGGLDTFWRIAEYLNPDLCAAVAPSRLLKEGFTAGGTDEEEVRSRRDDFLAGWMKKI